MTYQERKIQSCIRLAREASRNSWQCTSLEKGTLKALRKVSREAIKDARYWKRQA